MYNLAAQRMMYGQWVKCTGDDDGVNCAPPAQSLFGPRFPASSTSGWFWYGAAMASDMMEMEMAQLEQYYTSTAKSEKNEEKEEKEEKEAATTTVMTTVMTMATTTPTAMPTTMATTMATTTPMMDKSAEATAERAYAKVLLRASLNADNDQYYDDCSERERSFARALPWFPAGISYQSLATSGFFYDGPGTRVRCFHCNGVLNWFEPYDIPLIKHAQHYPSCQFATRALQMELMPRNDDATRTI